MENPLIKIDLGNVGEFAKPANTLVDRVCGGVGRFLEPIHAVRNAKAQIEISDLQKRGIQRVINQAERQQANIESVVEKAIPLLNLDSKPENIEQDLLDNFIEKAKNISNEEMQLIWAKILAAEVNAPGNISKNTLKTLDSMDINDAKLFENLCSFVCTTTPLKHHNTWNMGVAPMIYDVEDEIYKNLELTFAGLQSLDTLGLVQHQYSGFTLRFISNPVPMFYGDRITMLQFNSSSIPHVMDIGSVLFTKPGFELFKACCMDKAKEENLLYLHSKWKKMGILPPTGFPDSMKLG